MKADRFAYTAQPEATRLRLAGLLWPQTLSNYELEQQWMACDASTSPISARMLRAELQRRDLR